MALNSTSATTANIPSAVDQAFEIAKNEFLKRISDAEKDDFHQLTSIDQVYDATDKLQREQGNSRGLRNLRKIQPFLECLRQYVGVLDTFAQAKPEILALIWGPIKFLIQVSSTYVKSFDKLLEAMSQFANHLPQFEKYAELFNTHDRIKYVLALFYRDLLDFHLIVLDFFKLKKWRIFFESLWPRYASKISVVLDNINKHTNLMGSEVTIADINEAFSARAQAHEHYERTRLFQEKQEFESIKSTIQPLSHDAELFRCLGGFYPNTGKWLIEKECFKDWVDESNTTKRLLWLEGIPGAGKTFLVSSVIDHMIKQDNIVLFAYASYRKPSSLSLLGMLHSLVFQLAETQIDLKQATVHLYDSNRREFLGSDTFIEKAFLELLRHVDDPYIIVDGIDEMEFLERQKLLKMLLRINDSHEGLRLLVSSRSENDITRLLTARTTSVRVDKENGDEIISYIEQRTKQWQEDCAAFMTIEAVEEIRKALRTVAKKSEGMFLYARLVLDNAFMQDILEDIRREVLNLPDGLDEAYKRIVDKIRSKCKPHEQGKITKILELVGCSKHPMTRHEIDQAVSMDSEDFTSHFGARRLRSSIELCLPLVEVQEGVVSFVHFTAKEYIFGQQSGFFLNFPEGHRKIAKDLLHYLCMDIFDPGLSDSDIEGSILQGAYILHEYAALSWYEHVKNGVKGQKNADVADLFQAISSFDDVRASDDFEQTEHATDITVQWLHPFKNSWSEAYDIMINASKVYEPYRLIVNEGRILSTEDPHTVSASLLRTRKVFNSLLCHSKKHKDNCLCTRLSSLYGLNLYKCDRLDCKFFRIGFESEKMCKTHVLSHDRPFKCSKPSCEYSDIGFTSSSQLERHSALHSSLPEKSLLTSGQTLDIKDNDKFEILVDCVYGNEEEYLRKNCGSLPEFKLQKLLWVAARHSTPRVVEILLNLGAKVNPDGGGFQPKKKGPMFRSHQFMPLIAAIEGENIDVIRLLLEKGADLHVTVPNRNLRKGFASATPTHQVNLYETAFLGSSPEIIKMLVEFTKARNRWEFRLETLIGRHYVEELDARISECVMLSFHLWHDPERTLSTLLKIVAKKTHSKMIADVLLRLGADVNYKSPNSYSTSATALWHVAKKSSQKAAEFMKFLLESGADPNLGSQDQPTKDLKGAKEISRWLGMDWEELVASTASKRPQSSSQSSSKGSNNPKKYPVIKDRKRPSLQESSGWLTGRV